MEMNKKCYDIIFVVLVYANTEDIIDFIFSTKKMKCTYKIVIVNSYYDYATQKSIEKIAKLNDCDCFSVKNNGYGAGNNAGIEYAVTHYNFRFLVISNPDIVINTLQYDRLKEYRNVIVGPDIVTPTGKKQNPFYIRNKYFPRLENLFLRKRNKIGYYSIISIYKAEKLINKISMKLSNTSNKKVYALHGSFIIFSREAIEKIKPVFDDNIFLFCEEMVLAQKCKENGIDMVYDSNFKVFHKEDGSMKFLKGKMLDEEIKSNTYVVDKYFSKT